MIRDVAVRLMGSLLGLLGNAVWIVAVVIGFMIGKAVASRTATIGCGVNC